MPSECVLVNFFSAHPVGHAIEALHDCLGHHAADPEQALRDYFAALLHAHGGDPSALWSHDGVHAEYLCG